MRLSPTKERVEMVAPKKTNLQTVEHGGVTLKDAFEAAQTDLRVMAKEGHSMTRPLGLVSGVLSSLPEGGDAPILLAKDTCEAILERAHQAEDADFPELGERLRGIVRTVSPVVAYAHGLLRV